MNSESGEPEGLRQGDAREFSVYSDATYNGALIIDEKSGQCL